MNKVVKVLGLGLVLGVSLMSCEKPELDEMNFEVKGWSSDLVNVEKSTSSLTGKSISTGKSTPDELDGDKVTIVVYGEQDVIDNTPQGPVYESLLIEGDITLLGSEPTESTVNNLVITGSVTYMIQTVNHPEYGQIDILSGSINYNDKDGNHTGVDQILPTVNYEIIYK